MSPITLLSDFGTQDASVAIAHGILLQQIPDAAIINISHDIKPFNTRQAAYLLSAAWGKFPAGTCHILLFDLFSEKTPRILVSELDDHYFITADNTVLPLAFDPVPKARQFSTLQSGQSFADWVKEAARAATYPKQGLATLPEHSLKTGQQKPLQMIGNEINCEVIHIDHYENVVLNITRDQFNNYVQGRNFTLHFAQIEDISEISDNYADVRPGIKLCRFNSAGYMEICVNRGNAASLFGLRIGSRNNGIKIIFE